MALFDPKDLLEKQEKSYQELRFGPKKQRVCRPILKPRVTTSRSMYVCMYVCIYVCMYVRTHASTYVCMYVCMYAKCMYVCIYVCMYVRTHASTYACIYVCMHVGMYCMYVGVYSHTYMHACMHAYIHTIMTHVGYPPVFVHLLFAYTSSGVSHHGYWDMLPSR